MDRNTIPLGEGMTIIVKASGDLFLQGETPMEARFQSNDDRVRVNQSNETLYFETRASLDLVVPRNVPVIIEKIGGSAFAQDFESPLVIHKIGGDLALRRVGALQIEKVGGSCLIVDAERLVDIHKIGGDLTLRGGAGEIQIDSIGGTGDVQVSGAETVQIRSGGDLIVYFSRELSKPVNLRAGASVEVYVPESISASFNLDSGAESIEVNLNRQNVSRNEEIESRRADFILGENGPLVEARAGADIRISDEENQPESIAEDLDNREKAWKEVRERRGGNPSWSFGFGFDRTSAWADMISRRAQEAARRAEQRTHRAMRHTEEHIRQAAEREIRRADVRYGAPSAPPPAPKVTEQERLMVLKMLQENKITVEQAEKLLAALEGRFDR